MRAFVLLLALACGGCIQASVVTCDDGLACPDGLACDEVHHGCVLPGQLAACAGLSELAPCTGGGVSGECYGGVCLPAGCGNGQLDPGETCDDGNRTSGDGCSGDCLSDESCGNGYLDVDEACDDGNLLSRDGCDSRCTTESLRWLATPVSPKLVTATVVHDPMRDVLFGVSPGAAWENAGSGWHQLSLPDGAVGSAGAGVFDTTCNCVLEVLRAADGHSYQAYRWDGATWSAVGSSLAMVTPLFTAAYDAMRGRTVATFVQTNVPKPVYAAYAFDGSNGWRPLPDMLDLPYAYGTSLEDPATGNIVVLAQGQALGATYDVQFDGTRWNGKQLPESVDGSLAYDPVLGVVALDGKDGSLYRRSFDPNTGAQWTGIGSSGLPAACGRANYVSSDQDPIVPLYDTAAGLVELGFDHATCTWDGSAWHVGHPFPGPAVAVLAHPSGRGVVVLTSTGNVEDPQMQTWWWTGAWTFVDAAHPPSGRTEVLGVHDSARDSSEIFGGKVSSLHCDTECGGLEANDAYRFDGSDWSAFPALPKCDSVVDDPRAQRLLCLGAGAQGGYALAGSGSAWELVTGLPGPDGTGGAAWDASGSDFIAALAVVGGLETYGGSAWAPLPLQPAGKFAIAPEPRTGGIVLIDPSTRAVWDATAGATAFSREPDLPLPMLASSSIAYAPATGTLAVLAETADATFLLLRDRTSATRDETCAAGSDADGDGLAGCDDPDCWWACAPTCPPYTSCDPASAP